MNIKKLIVVIKSVMIVYIFASSQPIWAMTCQESLAGSFRGASVERYQVEVSRSLPEKLIGESEQALRRAGIEPIEGHGREERWTLDGVEYAKNEYERAFSDVLREIGVRNPVNYFEGLLSQLRASELGTNVVDLMGSGFFVENQSLADSISGMRFGPFAKSELPEGYVAERVPTEILGDIINPATWSRLDQSMTERGIAHLDLVTLRPEGGWQHASWNRTAENNIHALKYVMGNVISRMSLNGHFYFELNIPQLPGRLSDHPLLQNLTREIEAETPYRLVLFSKVSTIGTTYSLSGALVPK